MIATPNVPFVGRVDERSVLRVLFDQVRAGPSVLVVISADAGYGKTALVTQAVRTAGNDLRVLRGGCDSPTGSKASQPYGPFVEALHWIPKYAPAYESARRWSGPMLRATAHPADIHRNDLLDIFEELVEEGPHVLVLEDLQWADPSSLDLLLFLVRNLPVERLAIVVTTRGVDAAREPERAEAIDNLRRRPDCHWLELAGLPPADLTNLALACGADRSLAAEVARRSGGSPLFVKEMVEANLRGGGITVPASVQDSVLARLAALSPQSRQVLELAAVIGEDVEIGLVGEVVAANADTARIDLDAAVSEAARERLLVRTGADYRFRHELEREAVYEAILPMRRQRWHELVAARLDAACGANASAQQCARIAAHWEKSGNQPAAAAAMLRAGFAAYEVNAYHVALKDLEDGIERSRLLPTDPPGWKGRRTEIAIKAAACARWIGRLAKGLEILRAALPIAEAGTTVRLWDRIGRYEHEQGNGAQAAEAYQEALKLPRSDAPASDWAELHAGFARLLMLQQKYAEAREHCQRALEAAGAMPSPARANALNTLGVVRFLTGEKDIGLALLEESGAMALEVHSAEDFWRHVGNMTYCLLNAGRIAEGVARAFEAWDTARSADIHRSVAVLPSLNNALIGLLMLGRWTEAVERATEALAHKPPPGAAASLHLLLAEVYALSGDRDAAEEELNVAQPQARNSTEPKILADALRIRAELGAQRNDIEEVRRQVAAGLKAMSPGDDPDSQLQLLDIALRAEADARGRRNARTEDVRKLLRQVDALELKLPEVCPPTGALIATCRAEAERARHKNASTWQHVARLWDSVENPYRAAYARMREAEALHVHQDDAAAEALGWAAERAAAVGARPLTEAIMAIAARRRLTLATAPVLVPRPRATTEYHLTPREITVIEQLVDGASAYEIGQALKVATRTATTHLQNIYKKLNVRDRESAIELVRAQRLLDRERD